METIIKIDGIVKGLNGDGGLMRQHFFKAKKIKDSYTLLVKSQTKNKHLGAVSIEYVGYKSSFMDWDNFVSSFKHIGDALKNSGVIIDDSPKIVREFMPKQVKVKRKEQRVEIIIRDL